jgi:hypothetical protein
MQKESKLPLVDFMINKITYICFVFNAIIKFHLLLMNISDIQQYQIYKLINRITIIFQSPICQLTNTIHNRPYIICHTNGSHISLIKFSLERAIARNRRALINIEGCDLTCIPLYPCVLQCNT